MYYYYGVGVWVQILRGQGARACFTLALREWIWNAPVISLILPAYDNTGSLGYPPHPVVYPSVFQPE